MWSFIKKLFGGTKEVTKKFESEVLEVVPPRMVEESPIVFLQCVLKYMIQKEQVKEYKCINEFLAINAIKPKNLGFSLDELNKLVITPEIKLFIKRFRDRSCKTTCAEFNNWIKTVEI